MKFCSPALSFLLLLTIAQGQEEDQDREKLLKTLSAPLKEIKNLSFSFSANGSSMTGPARVHGRVRLVRGEFLSIETARYESQGLIRFDSTVFERTYATRLHATLTGTQGALNVARTPYDEGDGLLLFYNYFEAGPALLPALFPEAFLASLGDFQIRTTHSGKVILSPGTGGGPVGANFTYRIDPKRAAVTDMLTRTYGFSAGRRRLEGWTNVGGVPLATSLAGDSAVPFMSAFAPALTLEFSNAVANAAEAPQRPAWVRDPLLPTGKDADQETLSARRKAEPNKAEHHFLFALKFPEADGATEAARTALELSPESVAARELFAALHADSEYDEIVSSRIPTRGSTGPLAALRAAIADLRRGEADAAKARLEEIPFAEPLTVRIQAARLKPAEFVTWFASKSRSISDSISAVRELAAPPGAQTSETIFPALEEEFFAALSTQTLPPALKVVMARHAQEGKEERYAGLIKHDGWIDALGDEVAAVAAKEEETLGPLSVAVVEGGTTNLELLKRYVTDRYASNQPEAVIKAVEASTRKFGDSAVAANPFLMGIGGGPQDRNKDLKKILNEMIDQDEREAAKGLLLAGAGISWMGLGTSISREAKKLLGRDTIELYRFAYPRSLSIITGGGGLGDFGIKRAEIIEILEGEAAAGMLRRDDLDPIQKWIKRNSKAERWVTLLEQAGKQFPNDPFLVEVLADAHYQSDAHEQALESYGKTLRLRAQVDPFEAGTASPALGVYVSMAMGAQVDAKPRYKTTSPLVMKTAFAAREAKAVDQGVEHLDWAMGNIEAAIDLIDVGQAYELLEKTDRAIEAYKRELIHSGGRRSMDFASMLNRSSGKRLCKLLQGKQRWEDLFLASQTWINALSGDRSPEVIAIQGLSTENVHEEAQKFQSEALKHLAPDHFAQKFLNEAAPEPADKETRLKAERLARRLKSDDPEERDRATQTLSEMGPEVAMVLKPLLEARDPEVRQRARVILDGWALPHYLKKFRDDSP